MKRLALCALVGLAAAACQSDRIASPSSPGAAVTDDALAASHGWRGDYLPPPWAPGIRVMQYNLYLGTNFGPIFAATTPGEFLAAAAAAYSELQQSNFPARARRIADQIVQVRPDAVGIEEVALWSVSAPYLGQGPPTSPFVVKYDFLRILLDALRDRGVRYIAAAVDSTSDVAAPVPTAFDASGNPTAFALVRFQDRDAVLVRAGVRYGNAAHGVYQTFLPLDLLGTPAGIYNGWSSVRVSVDGRAFRFVATHLNAEYGPVNSGQALELMAVLQGVTDPVVLVGDFNSGPGVTDPFAPTYGIVTGAGFTDLWPVAHPNAPGLTNGPNDGVGALNAEGVLIPYPTLDFTTRVDLVFVRDQLGAADDVHAGLFGIRQDDRTRRGLWPSDHAGVGMVFELPGHFAHRP